MTDKDDYYVLAQPVDEQPDEITIVIDGTEITYSDFQGVVTKSKITPDQLAYAEKTVTDRTESTAYEVTDD